MRARLAEDDGFTFAAVVVLMALVLTLSGIAMLTGVHGLRRSTEERDQERAQAAADAGLDVAAYRMNKALVTAGGASILGVDTSALQLAGCVGANAVVDDSSRFGSGELTGPYRPSGTDFQVTTGISTALSLAPAADEFCDLTGAEQLTDGGSFRYATSVGFVANVGTGSPPVVRKIVAIGSSGGVTRRVIGTYWIDFANVGFERRRYVRCPASYPTGDPFSNCPNDPPY